MNTFHAHDRAVEASPERQQLSAAMSRLSKLTNELQLVRAQLETERAQANSFRSSLASSYERQQHSDRLAEAEKTFHRLRYEEEGAKAEVARLRDTCHSKKLEGRVEVHTHLTATIIDRMRALLAAAGDDREFRAQLAADGLRCEAPLHSIVADEVGGSARVDKMAAQVEAWLVEIERRNPYGLTEPAKPKRKPQPAVA